MDTELNEVWISIAKLVGSAIGLVIAYLVIRLLISGGVRDGMRMAEMDKSKSRPSPTGKYEVFGVDRSAKREARSVYAASSPEIAKAMGEADGMIVTSVRNAN